MKIKIVDKERNLYFAFPNLLVFNHVALAILKKNDNDGTWKNVKPSHVRNIRRTVRRMKKTHKGWYLVEVECADGTGVKIKL